MRDYYTIRPPVSRQLGPTSPVLVRNDSRPALHRYTETLAYYFKKELHFDAAAFKAAEATQDHSFEAWLFHKQADDQVTDDDYENGVMRMPRRVVGAACFRQFEASLPDQWTLEWVWFHPYVRGRVGLTECWLEWERRYGQFVIEEPLSKAMIGFLTKVRPNR